MRISLIHIIVLVLIIVHAQMTGNNMYYYKYTEAFRETGKLFFNMIIIYEKSTKEFKDNNRQKYGRSQKPLAGQRNEGGADSANL